MGEEYFEAPLNQVKAGSAIAGACIVKTLDEMVPGFKQRFQENLEAAYREVRGSSGIDCLELLGWLREMVSTGEFDRDLVKAAKAVAKKL